MITLRDLFRNPKEKYPLADLQALLGWSDDDLEEHLSDLDVERNTCSWAEVVSIVLRELPRHSVERKLGRVLQQLPPLVRLRTLRVRLPAYLVFLLEHLTRRVNEGRRVPLTVSDLLVAHLEDLASSMDASIERAIPGFTAALQYPDEPVRRARRYRGRQSDAC